MPSWLAGGHEEVVARCKKTTSTKGSLNKQIVAQETTDRVMTEYIAANRDVFKALARKVTEEIARTVSLSD